MATCLDLEDDVTCCVCVDLFRDPVMLPCMHTLCNPCALQVRGRSGKPNVIQCPLCQAYCKYSQLRMDFNKRKLVDIYKKGVDRETSTQSIPSEEKHACGFCEEGESNWKCIDCNITLCTKCKAGHSKLPVCNTHTITELNQAQQIPEDSPLNKLKEYESKLDSLQNECKVNYESIEVYMSTLSSQVEDLKNKISDLEDHITSKIEAKIKRESDKGIGALITEEDAMSKYCGDLNAKQNELEETLVVIRNVLQEHGNSASKDQDPFLFDVLNQAENVHNEIQIAIQKLTVPNEKLVVNAPNPDLDRLLKGIEVSVFRRPSIPTTHAQANPVMEVLQDNVQEAAPTVAECTPPTTQAPPTVSKVSSFFSKMTSSQKKPEQKRDASAKRKSFKSKKNSDKSDSSPAPPRPPPPYTAPERDQTSSQATILRVADLNTSPTERVSLATVVPRSALATASKKPPRRIVSDPGTNNRPRGHRSRREVSFRMDRGMSPPPYTPSVSPPTGQLLIDVPLPSGPAAFSIGPPSLGNFSGRHLIKRVLYDCNTRPSRIHVIENMIWIVLEDGSITALNKDGSHLRDFSVHTANQSSQSDVSIPCVVSAVTSAHNGDLIAACVGLAHQVKEGLLANSQPGLCIINEGGQCLHIITYDHYLDVSRGGESIYALRKSDRNVMEFKLRENYWTFMRKIELVPTTQYTRLLVYDEYLYASSVLPDVIHKVQLHSGQIKTLGFRGSGSPGELRSPRVSCTDEEGNVLVTDYWNNRLQVLLPDNSWWALYVEGEIAGPQDAILDVRTNILLVPSYVDQKLYAITFK